MEQRLNLRDKQDPTSTCKPKCKKIHGKYYIQNISVTPINVSGLNLPIKIQRLGIENQSAYHLFPQSVLGNRSTCVETSTYLN